MEKRYFFVLLFFLINLITISRKFKSGNIDKQLIGCDHKQTLCTYHQASPELVDKAIKGCVAAQEAWESMPFNERAAIFLRAADLLSTKYRFKLMAATMLGQGKNVWQAEIDAAAELCDFWRFNVKFADEIYRQQPPENATGVWNRTEWRPLEGFVLSVSPFNFTAIGGNLPSAPALMGNVSVWKPAPAAVYSNYLVMKLLQEAGLPDGVIQFVPGPAPEIVSQCFKSPDFAGLHFTGSTAVFKKLWKDIASNIDIYRSYPRIVGETGGKNMHFIHKSADPDQVALHSVRASFEFQGQKCSALSRMYCPDNLWPQVKKRMLDEVSKLKIGPVDDFSNFITNVINRQAFDKIKSYIDYARDSSDAQIIAGGKCDDSVGYFIHPTIIETKDLHFKTMEEEIFGPVMTCYVYPADEYEKYLEIAASSTEYGLTAAIFSQDRYALAYGRYKLRNAAGNFYMNDKCTGAVVGQQPFGGARGSGTNDKAGAALNLYRWVSARSIKENFCPIETILYPSNFSG